VRALPDSSSSRAGGGRSSGRSRVPSRAPRLFAGVLLTVLALAAEARAGEISPGVAPPSWFSLGLTGLPSASASPPAAASRRFLTAAGEPALAEVLPWIYDRHIAKEDFARISWHTVSENWKAGFGWDSNPFEGNESFHPFQGSLFFEAGRSNGFTYWESGLFALTGSLFWEFCMENARPSTNDLVNTTLGGMVRGEAQYRLAAMLLDNTATGSERFWREVGAAVLNPMGTLTRLVNGDMGRTFENPQDRLPDGFLFSADLGYRRVDGTLES